MTNNQQHDIAKKTLYAFQRLAMLGLIVLLLYMGRWAFAFIFCLFYWNRPEYDAVRKVIKGTYSSQNQKSE
ncbi:MAG: hypothetical protein K9G46_07060 [Flavobacteriales bacterium]|nr:hypothetical protein [Flavobacteriales bacterium]